MPEYRVPKLSIIVDTPEKRQNYQQDLLESPKDRNDDSDDNDSFFLSIEGQGEMTFSANRGYP